MMKLLALLFAVTSNLSYSMGVERLAIMNNFVALGVKDFSERPCYLMALGAHSANEQDNDDEKEQNRKYPEGANRSFAYLCLMTLYQRHMELLHLSVVPVSSHFKKYLIALAAKASGDIDEQREIETFDAVASFRIPLGDEDLLTRLRRTSLSDICQQRRTTMMGLSIHKCQAKIGEAAQYFGIELLNRNPVAYLESKCEARLLFKKLGINHPRGIYETPVTSPESAAEHILRLHETYSDIAFIVKLDRGSGGNAHWIFDPTKEINDKEQITISYLTQKLQGVIHDKGHVVEEYIQRESSPASIYFVTDAGVEHVFSYLQILDGRTLSYQGARGPLSPFVPIIADGLRVAEELHSLGFRGPFGIDFVIDSDATHYAVDLNLHTPATFYAYATAVMVLPDGLKNKVLYARPGTRVWHNKKIPLDSALFDRHLEELRSMFYLHTQWENPHTIKEGRGCIVYNDSLRQGMIDVVCVAPTIVEAENDFEQFIKSAQNFFVNSTTARDLQEDLWRGVR